MSRPSRGPAGFFFALGCPISYLVAERVERALGEIEWIPVLNLRMVPGSGSGIRMTAAEALAVAEREAHTLRLPLQAPDNLEADTRPLTRAALFAAQCGVASRFALAAARLIFCGGYSADDSQVIADAADVAGLPVEEALWSAGDTHLDRVLEVTARSLRSRGIESTPAIRIGHRWFVGLGAVPGASTYAAVSDGSGPAAPAV